MEFDSTFLLYSGILLLVGLVTGFINTVAGGGSLLTLPVFIFMGFDSAVANATNRVAVFYQSLTSIFAFRRQGIRGMRYGLWLGLSATVGAVIGTFIAMKMDNEVFKTVLAIVMFVVVILILLDPLLKKAHAIEIHSPLRLTIALIIFFFIGIYGGFLQAGIGFVIIATLSTVNKMNLVKINNIKVIVVFIYTAMSVAIFAWKGVIDWKYGMVLAVGQSAGGWAGSVWSVRKGEKWIRRVLLLMLLVMGLKLLDVPFLNP